MSEYSSSFIANLSISKTESAGRYGVFIIHGGIGHSKEGINHHATQTPRSTQTTVLFKRALEGTVMLSIRVFSGGVPGKGQRQILELS